MFAYHPASLPAGRDDRSLSAHPIRITCRSGRDLLACYSRLHIRTMRLHSHNQDQDFIITCMYGEMLGLVDILSALCTLFAMESVTLGTCLP